jgi:cobyrinic acid a,c-diamide synthase
MIIKSEALRIAELENEDMTTSDAQAVMEAEQKKFIVALEEVFHFYYSDERKHWEESEKPAKHIYHKLKTIASWLENWTR